MGRKQYFIFLTFGLSIRGNISSCVRHCSVLIFLLALCCAGANLYAQGDHFSLSIAHGTWENQAQDTKLVNTILNLVSDNLRQHGFILDFANSEDEDSDMNLFFSFLAHDIRIQPTKSPLAAISPVLFEPTHSYRLAADEPRTHEGAASLITALLFYTQSRCDLAEPYWQNAWKKLTFYVDAANIPILEGNCALLAGDYETAIKQYESREERTRIMGGFEFYPNIAWSYLQIGDETKAFELMDTLIYINKNTDDTKSETTALSQRAQLYALVENYDTAIADLTSAIELTPDNLDLYLLRGKMYLAQYEWDSALADYNKAIELDPTYADAYYERGVLYYSILQTGVELRAEAFDDFHRYLELAPDGDHAADAARYTAQIEKELEALNG